MKNIKNLLKKVYNGLPYKKQFFLAIKKFWLPPHNITKHLYFKDIFDIEMTTSNSIKMRHYGFEVENEIFWYGLYNGWESDSLKLWTRLCENSDVILDIGANTGIYALTAKAVNPDSKVYAFEPIKRVFSKLCENVELNKFDIKCFESAVSNVTGTAVVYDIPSEHIYSVTVNKNLHSSEFNSIETQINTVSLINFIENENLQHIDLIKIDVETHEPEVLQGFGHYLQKFAPTMLIEVLDDQVGERVEQLLTGMDYLYFDIDEKGSIKQVEKIKKSSHYNYLICSKKTAQNLNLSS